MTTLVLKWIFGIIFSLVGLAFIVVLLGAAFNVPPPEDNTW